MKIFLLADVGAQLAVPVEAPDGVVDWLIWHLKPLAAQLLTLDALLVLIALVLGLLSAIGATEFSKRFAKLFSGPNWVLKAQLCAAVWGTVVTAVLIWVMTDLSAKGQLAAIVAVAPLSAFYPHRAYDALRARYPNLMGKALERLRGAPGPGAI